jgi:hypothetical protein
MSSSTNLLIFICAAVAIVGVAGYFIYINLSENTPSGQLARSRLGLDTYPGIDLLKDPKVRDYKSSPDAPVYRNVTKGLIENPYISEHLREYLKQLE